MARKLVLTRHAALAAAERGIAPEWIQRAVAAPDWVAPDGCDPSLRRAFASIVERSGRILRVVYRLDEERDEAHVVTVFFDRKAKRP